MEEKPISLAPQTSFEPTHQALSPSSDPQRAQEPPIETGGQKIQQSQTPSSEVTFSERNGDKTGKSRPPKTCRTDEPEPAARGHPIQSQAAEETEGREESGRERLKRHRVEMAGRVWIPEIWGQEELLKDWIDCTAFDAALASSNIVSARAALVGGGRIRANSGGLRIENRC